MKNQEAIGILLNEQKCLERNDGTQCDRKCESCDLVMDVGIIREAFNKAISALQAQDLQPTCNNLAKDTNVPCKDTISRQAAIDELKRYFHDEYYQRTSIQDCIDCFIEDILIKLPSAQPDAVTASLEELINDYGEDGFFIVDGVNYHANELLNELKTNSSVGEKFRKQITKTIVQYFMKFGD